jgi:hypothetical protein
LDPLDKDTLTGPLAEGLLFSLGGDDWISPRTRFL